MTLGTYACCARPVLPHHRHCPVCHALYPMADEGHVCPGEALRPPDAPAEQSPPRPTHVLATDTVTFVAENRSEHAQLLALRQAAAVVQAWRRHRDAGLYVLWDEMRALEVALGVVVREGEKHGG